MLLNERGTRWEDGRKREKQPAENGTIFLGQDAGDNGYRAAEHEPNRIFVPLGSLGRRNVKSNQSHLSTAIQMPIAQRIQMPREQRLAALAPQLRLVMSCIVTQA